MKIAAGVASDANLVRIALWSLGDHLGVDMPNGVFDLRERKGWIYARKRANPKVRQHELFPRAKPKAPAPNHPWRGRKDSA